MSASELKPQVAFISGFGQMHQLIEELVIRKVLRLSFSLKHAYIGYKQTHITYYAV